MKSNPNPISYLWPALLPLLPFTAMFVLMAVIWFNDIYFFPTPLVAVVPPLLFAMGAIYRMAACDKSRAVGRASDRLQFRFGTKRLFVVMAVIGMSLALTHSQGGLGLAIAVAIALPSTLLVVLFRREHVPIIIRTALFSLIGAAFLSFPGHRYPYNWRMYWLFTVIQGAVLGWLVVVIGSRFWDWINRADQKNTDDVHE